MTDTVISVEDVWKQYRLGSINHGTLKADLASWWALRFGKEDPNAPVGWVKKANAADSTSNEFWALKEISFEVKQGEVLGVIGKNGAGKSTLLKLLSRVTAPSRGQIKVKGRIASLLEVGTGFHPELTGRENIFLNGAILGMEKGEIRRKLEEIISFSEVEQFIDTPVKRYSSGMYVRLAFSVAAHLEPEILIIDEILAVGDSEFQKKCIGKMNEVAGRGRTVIFVSHNMGAVKSLCERCVVLESGALGYSGDVASSVNHYFKLGRPHDTGRRSIHDGARIKGGNLMQIQEIATLNAQLVPQTTFLINEEINIELRIHSQIEEAVYLWIFFTNQNGDAVISSHQGDTGTFRVERGTYSVSAKFESLGLLPGVYNISAGIFDTRRNFLDWIDGVISINIDVSFKSGKGFDQRLGMVDRGASWTIVGLENA